MDTTHPQGKGLEILPIDDRDFSHTKKFGQLGESQLPISDFTVFDKLVYTVKWGDTFYKIANRFSIAPSDLLLSNSKIKDINKIYVGQLLTIPQRPVHVLNQVDLDFCTAFATAVLQYLIFGIPIDPLFQFSKIKEIRGEYKAWGANLRDACKSVTKYGSLAAFLAPYTHSTPALPTDKSRDFLANWLNYPSGLDIQAAKEKELSYFAVDGNYDAFDNIRSTLWIHRMERRAVLIGMMFDGSWPYVKDGIIPKTPSINGGGHAVAIVGQKAINGELYLIVQNSWGDQLGDHGFYYFPRSVINQIALQGFGMYTFSRFEKSSLAENILNVIGSFFNKLLGKI